MNANEIRLRDLQVIHACEKKEENRKIIEKEIEKILQRMS